MQQIPPLSHLRQCLHPAHLRRTGSIALIVGTWLTAFNQGDALWSDEWDVWLLFKVSLNYLTPFAVANLGLLSNKPQKSNKRSHTEE